MAERALLIEVRWPDGRFHGVRDETVRSEAGPVAPEWPPSPFRLFQAMVAGAFGGRWATSDDADVRRAAFEWFEALPPPTMSAPPRERLEPVTHYVPNNDLDAKGGDPARVSEIRVAKELLTSSFEPDRPVAYLWPLAAGEEQAARIALYAERLHTLGHGIDAAFAFAAILDLPEAESRLGGQGGAILRPALSGAGPGTPCPARGSLDSLLLRHRAALDRFETTRIKRRTETTFRQPPKAHARRVFYDASASRLLFDLRPLDGSRPFSPQPQERVAAIATAVRDLLASRLGPDRPEVERLVVGRGAREIDLPKRIRIVPLPSIGASHTDPSVRRVLVEIPPDGGLAVRDIAWALSGRTIALADPGTGATGPASALVPSSDPSMLRHYGVARGSAAAPSSRRWRTVTPAVLPELAARRRGPKSGSSRQEEEARAAAAVAQALRHALVDTRPLEVRVQREPFDTPGARAEAFAPGSRFPADRFWHVEIVFEHSLTGPLLIGDGRFAGLGLLRPGSTPVADIFRFLIASDRNLRPDDAETVAQAVRRALMARARDRGGAALALFSGHESGGGPARSGQHQHVYLAVTPAKDGTFELAVIAPWRVDRTFDRGRSAASWFESVVEGLAIVRAGRAGLLTLSPARSDAAGIMGRSRDWVLATPLVLDRHPPRGEDVEAFAERDLQAAFRRLGRPVPAVRDLRLRGTTVVEARLRFPRGVTGPLLVGRSAHRGGGLFVTADAARIKL